MIKTDVASPSYKLLVLIQNDNKTTDFIIEKGTVTSDVTLFTYYESSEAV
jgi:hypothetical protein